MILNLALILFISLTDVLGFNNRNLQEGKSCQLPDENLGVCRKILDCPDDAKKVLKKTSWSLCKSSGKFRVICCPSVATIKQVHTMCESVPILVESRLKSHIVGKAEIAEVGEFPFMGLLMYKDPTKRCGAVLLTNKLLLTAAHCFRQGNATHVRLGTNSATDGGAEPYGIARIVTHPDYKWKLSRELAIMADIAIVELDEVVDPNDMNIAPLCLYGSLEDLPQNQNLTIVGWGTTNTGTKSTPNTLMKGTVRTSLHSKCQASYKKMRNSTISSSHLCTQGDGDSDGVYTDACWGDSGGPLVMLKDSKYFLVGIVSSGHFCGLREYPGIYTRVASYLDWVMNEIQSVR